MQNKHETIYLPFPSVILEKIDNYLNAKYLSDFLCKFSYFDEEIGRYFYPLYIEHGKNVADYMRFVREDVASYFKDKIRKNIAAYTFDERIKANIFSDFISIENDNPEYIAFRMINTLSFTNDDVKDYCKAFKKTYKKTYGEVLNVNSEKFDATTFFIFTIFMLNGKDAEKTESIITKNYRDMFLNFDFSTFFAKYEWCEEITAYDLPYFEEFCGSDELEKVDYITLIERFKFQKDEYIRVQVKGETEERQKEIIAYAQNGFETACKELAKELLDAYNKFITENNYKWNW